MQADFSLQFDSSSRRLLDTLFISVLHLSVCVLLDVRSGPSREVSWYLAQYPDVASHASCEVPWTVKTLVSENINATCNPLLRIHSERRGGDCALGVRPAPASNVSVSLSRRVSPHDPAPHPQGYLLHQ